MWGKSQACWKSSMAFHYPKKQLVHALSLTISNLSSSYSSTLPNRFQSHLPLSIPPNSLRELFLPGPLIPDSLYACFLLLPQFSVPQRCFVDLPMFSRCLTPLTSPSTPHPVTLFCSLHSFTSLMSVSPSWNFLEGKFSGLFTSLSA